MRKREAPALPSPQATLLPHIFPSGRGAIDRPFNVGDAVIVWRKGGGRLDGPQQVSTYPSYLSPSLVSLLPKGAQGHKATESHAACRRGRNGRKCDAINPARRTRYHCLPCSEYVQDPTTPINSMRCLFPPSSANLPPVIVPTIVSTDLTTYRLHALPAGTQPILLPRHPIPTLPPRRTQNPNIAEPLPMGCFFSASSATASIRLLSIPPHPQAPTFSPRPSSSSPETRDVTRTTTKPACLGGHCSQGVLRASQTLLFVRVGCRWSSANP
ncbi:hypothetical protein EDB80DRAFT_835411 [Ilyonectria destructans]|nr:hypothetical protein EDB80DRAFT_835411 [Ilyonectria destructans]